MKTEIIARRLSELETFRGESIAPDHPLYVSRERGEALRSNPYLDDTDAICQWVGYADGKIAGFNYSFPIRVWADGHSFGSTTGSSLNVADWARKSGLGLILPAKGVEITSKDGIAIAAACSQMAIPVHKVNGYKFFLYPRYIALWKSRSVVEMYLPKILSKVFSHVIDVGVWLYRQMLAVFAMFALHGYRVEKVLPDDEEACKTMADIVSCDGHRFREDHDAAWFKWHLNYSFSKYGPAQAYVLKRKKSGETVAFVMAKRRFYEQASHRGFKNVWLGSIMEWGARDGMDDKLKWFIVKIALSLARSCDAVDFSTADGRLGSFVKCLGWRQVGEANVGVKVMKNFPLFGDKAIQDISNWRIRPAMGDNGLS